jgi:hypothetical protein
VTVFDTSTRQERTYEDFREAAGIGGQTAIVGVSRRSLFLRTMRVPDTDPATVRQILAMQTGDLFPVGPGEVAVDFLPLSDVNADGRLALVVAIPAGDLRRIRQEAREIGLRVERVVPVALGSAIVARGIGRPDSAVISREPGGLGIDVVGGGELRHSRLVPTTALLDAEVCRTFTVAGLPCGDTVAASNLNVPGAAAEAATTPLEALATGWPDEWRLNLELPEEIEARTKAESRLRMRSSVFLALAAGALLAFVAQEHSEKVEAVRIQVGQQEGKLRNLHSIQKDAETKATTQVGYQNTLLRAFRPAQRVGDVTALASNLAPANVWLTGVSVERGKNLVIRGTSKDGASVTAYAQRLSSEPRLRDVNIVFANDAVMNETPVVQFSITAFPVGNLPLNEPTTKKRSTPAK